MDTVAIGLYQGYVNFADNLEERLAAIYGRKKANRFFQRMDQSRFETVCRTASNDALKRQWLSRLRESTRMLDDGKAGEAA